MARWTQEAYWIGARRSARMLKLPWATLLYRSCKKTAGAADPEAARNGTYSCAVWLSLAEQCDYAAKDGRSASNVRTETDEKETRRFAPRSVRKLRGAEESVLAPRTRLRLYEARKIALAHGGRLELDANRSSNDRTVFSMRIRKRGEWRCNRGLVF